MKEKKENDQPLLLKKSMKEKKENDRLGNDCTWAAGLSESLLAWARE
jgi:hypothetical protein